MEEQNNKKVTKIEEQYFEVSESRIKNAISEYNNAHLFSGVLGSSFASGVSFLIAYISYQTMDFWKTLFLVLTIVSWVVFIVFGILWFAGKKNGHGNKKWLYEEIINNHPLKIKKRNIDKGKLTFKILNVFFIIGIPLTVLLIVLGVNNWDIFRYNWGPIFMVVWIVGTIAYILFGTYINSIFAYMFFGFESDWI